MVVWGGHSCPPLLILFWIENQNQIQRQRTRVSVPRNCYLVYVLQHGVGKTAGLAVQAYEGSDLASCET
jgi:hypothetical protein